MLECLARAQRSIELEIYIYEDDDIGRRFLEALTTAAKRGVRVRLLVDAGGSYKLAKTFFQPLLAAGGEMKFFNPLRFNRFGVRDHRKLLVCDGEIFFVGGANIANEYDGDGVQRGWCELVIRQKNPELAAMLVKAFEAMFNNAEFEGIKRKRLRALRPLRLRGAKTQLIAIKPGRGPGEFQRQLQGALATAKTADFITPYFLPGRKLRQQLRKIARRGGKVRLILAAKTDVPLARLAALIFYPRLLRAGVEIYEYQPQVLHAKLYRVDGDVFIGSSNLDVRSLRLNYELMLRFSEDTAAAAAQNFFDKALKHSRQIHWEEFRRSLSFWQRCKNRWAHFLLARVDPLIALRHLP